MGGRRRPLPRRPRRGGATIRVRDPRTTSSRRRLRGSPEASDREGPDVRRRGSGNRDDRVEEGEERDAEDDQAQDQEVRGGHLAGELKTEEPEGQAEDDEVHDLEDVGISRDPGRLRVRERGRRVRQDRRQAPDAAAVVVGREGHPAEGTDVVVDSDRPAEGPERLDEGHQREEDREADHEEGRFDQEEQLELRPQAWNEAHCPSKRRTWIKRVGYKPPESPVQDVFLAAAAVDSLLELLVELLVELDRVRIDARPDHFDRFLEL